MKILVAGISVRAMAESAVRSGYSIIALDAFADQDLRSLAEAHSLHHDFGARYSSSALYEAARQLDFDSVAYTSNLENHPGILECFSKDHRIIGNAPEVIRSVRCWKTLVNTVRQAGFLFPDTILNGSNGNAKRKGAWLVKPVLSGGGHGISFAKEDARPGHNFLLQQYIPGVPCSASFVADRQDCVVIGIAQQLIGLPQLGAAGFRYCGNLLPSPAGQGILEQVRRLAAFLTRQFGLVGVNGMDFILKGDQIVLTEVNPRYSASMELIEIAYGLPVFQLHLQAALEQKLPEFELEDVVNTRKFFGKCILFAAKNAVAPDTRSWRSRGIRDIPGPGEMLKESSPICTSLSGKSGYDETFTDLIRQASLLEKEIYV